MNYPIFKPVDHTADPQVMSMVSIAAEITVLEARYRLYSRTPLWAARRHMVLCSEYADRVARKEHQRGGPFAIGDDLRG